MSARLERWGYAIFAVLAGCAVFALARANRLVFPYPWNDEARFYLPALWWAEHLSLRPLNVNAPEGIFWVPDGFTIWLGLMLRLFGSGIDTARTLMEVTVSAGVAVYALAFRRLAGSWQMGAAATLLLVSPPVVFAANMVRMEAPLLLLLGLALLASAFRYRLAAGALLLASLLFHPALSLALAGYLLVSLWRRDWRRPVAWEWGLLAAVLVATGLEAAHLAAHLPLLREHMAFQAERKLGVPLLVKLLKPQAGAFYLCCVATGWLAWRRGLDQPGWTVAALALGVMLYSVLGAEMEYAVYLLTLGPAMVFCVACRELSRRNDRTADSLRE